MFGNGQTNTWTSTRAPRCCAAAVTISRKAHAGIFRRHISCPNTASTCLWLQASTGPAQLDFAARWMRIVQVKTRIGFFKELRKRTYKNELRQTDSTQSAIRQRWKNRDGGVRSWNLGSFPVG